MVVRPTIMRLTIVLAVLLVAAPIAAQAQQPGNVPRIGHLFVQPWSVTGHLRDAFRQGLRELGYVEGQIL